MRRKRSFTCGQEAVAAVVGHRSRLSGRRCGDPLTSDKRLNKKQNAYFKTEIKCHVSSRCHLFGTEREQKLFILTGSQNTCRGPDLESTICGQVKLVLRRFCFWGFPWKHKAQAGLHDPPAERQLHVTAERERTVYLQEWCCAAVL